MGGKRPRCDCHRHLPLRWALLRTLRGRMHWGLCASAPAGDLPPTLPLSRQSIVRNFFFFAGSFFFFREKERENP